MKKTEFEFFIHKFDYILPLHSTNKNLITEQREQVLSCLGQLKVKMVEVVTNLNVTSNGLGGLDYDRCVHLVKYYNNALKVIRDKELSNERIKERPLKTYTYSEAAKINSRFD